MRLQPLITELRHSLREIGLLREDDDATREQLLYSPETFLFAEPGDRVLLHLNLGHKMKVHGLKTWSVKDIRGAKTIGHVFAATIRDATFTVRPGGNALVRETGEKTVHAWVDGRLASSNPPGQVVPIKGTEVRYNPHLGMTHFMRQDERGDWVIPVASADLVYLSPDWKVYAVGITDLA